MALSCGVSNLETKRCLWNRPHLSQICPCWNKNDRLATETLQMLQLYGCNLPLVSTRSFNLCVTFVPLRGLTSPPQIRAVPPHSAFEEWGDGRFQTRLCWFLLKLKENRRKKRKRSRCIATFNLNFPALYCNLLNVEDCLQSWLQEGNNEILPLPYMADIW